MFKHSNPSDMSKRDKHFSFKKRLKKKKKNSPELNLLYFTINSFASKVSAETTCDACPAT